MEFHVWNFLAYHQKICIETETKYTKIISLRVHIFCSFHYWIREIELIVSPGLFYGIWSDKYIGITFTYIRYGHDKRTIIETTLKLEALYVQA